jgi:hypothetical protein
MAKHTKPQPLALGNLNRTSSLYFRATGVPTQWLLGASPETETGIETGHEQGPSRRAEPRSPRTSTHGR